MLEIFGIICIIYCIGAIITFIPLAFIHGGKSDTYGIGMMIAAGLAFFWPVSVPLMIHVEWEERKLRKEENARRQKNRN